MMRELNFFPSIVFLLSIVLITNCEHLDARTETKIDKDVSGDAITRSKGSSTGAKGSAQGGRHFYMGFTPFPYDFTVKAVFKTYDTINEHGDLIAHHLDEGIPWQEALDKAAYHKEASNTIDFRVKQTTKNKKVYLAVSPIGIERKGMTYWGKKPNMSMPRKWKGKGYDHPDSIEAYTNFCRFMIKKFNPDYMAYGIEVNLLAKNDPKGFQKFRMMARKVYETLKKEYPALPIFLTFQLEEIKKNENKQIEAVKSVLDYTDYMAVSSYPYMGYEVMDHNNLPENYFSEFSSLDPKKPFAIVETGFIAKDLGEIRGSEQLQAKYVEFVLEQANKLNAEFVTWFVLRDYDKAVKRIKRKISKQFILLLAVWQNTGFFDQDGRARISLSVWDKWLEKPLIK